MTQNIPILITRDKHGYFLQCPIIQGAYAQGDTYEEGLKNMIEVLELILEDFKIFLKGRLLGL